MEDQEMKSFTNSASTRKSPDPTHQKQQSIDEDRLSYLRPNRYFKFYLFREKDGNTTCWLPEGFCI